eukprot:TRINITY_DN79180_c0_g1_i1.p1 TRINITY_DN79180_c0_g1~~TRINITY_DN79180_c0_g1_i1.p1  ORF type:complete len:120 (-),score=6.36 TRINITY_DN79180_c0_g1_i1:124-483(-)
MLEVVPRAVECGGGETKEMYLMGLELEDGLRVRKGAGRIKSACLGAVLRAELRAVLRAVECAGRRQRSDLCETVRLKNWLSGGLASLRAPEGWVEPSRNGLRCYGVHCSQQKGWSRVES